MAKSETNNNGVSHIHNLVKTVIEQAGCLRQAVNQYPPLSVERDKEIQSVAPRYTKLPDMWGYAIKQASEIGLVSVLGPLEDLQKAHNNLIDVSVDCRPDSSKWVTDFTNHCEAINRLTNYLLAVESASEMELTKAKEAKEADLEVNLVPDDGRKEQDTKIMSPRFMSVRELAEHFEVDNKDALRKRMERFRKKNALNSDAFREVQNAGVHGPRFLYNTEMVSGIITELKRTQTSVKRPSKRKKRN